MPNPHPDYLLDEEIMHNHNAADITDSVDTDEKAKVSSNDTTAGYLNGKLVAGTGITLTEGNDAGNETLTIASTGGGGTDLNAQILAYLGV